MLNYFIIFIYWFLIIIDIWFERRISQKKRNAQHKSVRKKTKIHYEYSEKSSRIRLLSQRTSKVFSSSDSLMPPPLVSTHPRRLTPGLPRSLLVWFRWCGSELLGTTRSTPRWSTGPLKASCAHGPLARCITTTRISLSCGICTVSTEFPLCVTILI